MGFSWRLAWFCVSKYFLCEFKMEGVKETLLNPSVIIGLVVGFLVSLVCYFISSSKTEKVATKESSKIAVIYCLSYRTSIMSLHEFDYS